MCGRYAFSRIDAQLLERLEAEGPPEGPLGARWNVAPGQDAPVLGMVEGRRRVALARWGFPRADGSAGLLINARAETVAALPAFRDAFLGKNQAARCLAPLSGWYEWKREGRLRRPHFLRPAGPGPFLMAGLWTPLAPHAAGVFTLLTCGAAASIAAIHHRMPVLLPEPLWAEWLAGAGGGADWAPRLLPWPDEDLEAWEVGPEVNGTVRDHEGLVAPAATVQGSLF
jgi:putative SOS response-associated peptidase YedK